jgi:hypothetical protein
LDLWNTKCSYSAVIGREDVQDEVINGDRSYRIFVEVFNDIGQRIHYNLEICYSLVSSDNVLLVLNVVLEHSRLIITDNLQVIFTLCNGDPFGVFLVKSLFFKSCGFHLQ